MGSQANNTTFTLMLIVAGLFDLIQFLLELAFGIGLILDSIVSIFAITIFFIWLSMNGLMDMQTGMRLMGFGAGEMFPFLNALPLWLAFVASIIIIQKKAALGPLAAAIPVGGKATGGGASAPKVPAETSPRQGKGTTTVWDDKGKVVLNEERF